ncbi:hypothetical protein FQN49_007243 [Arthroderma sp. PD_2]|nr:hypothetical protein FQN49_007243 [Arthroderma sp. PD_2]
MKAGVVPGNVFVGVSSYGRSFRMSDPSCTGPQCTFTSSYGFRGGEPGQCTGTGGYNPEPDLGGISDWAIDLGGWHPGVKQKGAKGWTVKPNDLNCDLSAWPSTLEDLDADIGKMPIPCRGMALLKILSSDLKSAVDKYREVSSSDDYDQRDSIEPRLRKFTALKAGEGLKYMDCKWSTPYAKGAGPCTEVNLYYPDYADLGVRSIEYTPLKNEEGFYSALLNEAGISMEWIRWTTVTEPDYCPPCPAKCEFARQKSARTTIRSMRMCRAASWIRIISKWKSQRTSSTKRFRT